MGRPRTLDQQPPALRPEQHLKVLSAGLTDEDAAIREQCAQQLASLKHPDAAPFLRHALDDDSEQVRAWGAYGLGLLAREQDRDELARAAESDESPLVRIWATFGRARLGEVDTVAQLISFLDLPDLEHRSNAADALLSLEDASLVRPLLAERFAEPDDRRRVWAAAVLHRLGHPGAFAAWREALVNPETRVDAALVASHLRSMEAARELVRVAAELTQDELEAPVPAANDLPLAEVLTSPLHELDLGALFRAAESDASLRADILLLVLRSPAADPEVLAQMSEFAGALDPTALGRDVAELLSEQSPRERPVLLARMVAFAAEAVISTVDALSPGDRTALFDALADAANAPTDDNAQLAPLLDLLRRSSYAEQFADLPAAPWGGEPETDIGVEAVEDPPDFADAPGALAGPGEQDGVGAILERMAAGEEVTDEERALAESALGELGMTTEGFVESGNPEMDAFELPPRDPQQVALRVLALAAMWERARVEKALAAKKITVPAAREAISRIRSWVENDGIDSVLSPLEIDLLQAEPGDWLDQDVEHAGTSAEALAVLLWAMGVTPSLPADKPASAEELLKRVPLLSPTEQFVARASLKEADSLELQRELYEAMLWRCEQESTARMILAGEEDMEIDLEAIRDELVKDGFDAKGGPAEALRFLGKKAAQRFADQMLLTPVGGDFAFRGKALSVVGEDELQSATALARERHRALNWVISGGDWDALLLEPGEIEEGEEELG